MGTTDIGNLCREAGPLTISYLEKIPYHMYTRNASDTTDTQATTITG
jgi:hypothetical protein